MSSTSIDEPNDTLFVRNLPDGTNKEEPRRCIWCNWSRKVQFYRCVIWNGRGKGFGFAQYALHEDAEAALKELQGKAKIGDKVPKLDYALKEGQRPDGGCAPAETASAINVSVCAPRKSSGVVSPLLRRLLFTRLMQGVPRCRWRQER